MTKPISALLIQIVLVAFHDRDYQVFVILGSPDVHPLWQWERWQTRREPNRSALESAQRRGVCSLSPICAKPQQTRDQEGAKIRPPRLGCTVACEMAPRIKITVDNYRDYDFGSMDVNRRPTEALMNPYQETKIINDFEEKFGNRESVKRGCEFLVSYISGLQRPLPEIAAQGFRVAVRYKEGSALRDELEIAEKQVVDFLDARHGEFKFLEYPIEHAVWGILHVYRDLRYHWEGGSAYEFVSGTLEWIENFDSNYELFTKLLKEYFPNK